MGRPAEPEHRLVVLKGGAIALCLAAAACGSDDDSTSQPLLEGDAASDAPIDRAADAPSESASDALPELGEGGAGGSAADAPADPAAPCPPDMAFVGVACMDRYEAPNVAGADPLVMQSATAAEKWCAAKGKRLCTEDEWTAGCSGAGGTKYPYGDVHEASRCNDDKTWIPVNEAALNTWPSAEAKAEVAKLWQGAPSGAYKGCASGWGVFDATGNVEEWVVRTKPHANMYPHVLMGCYWAGCYGGSKPTCTSTNPAHADGFLYYETGFRCCRDAAGPGG